MKIYAFEVGDDEAPFFQRLAAEDNIDLVLSSEGLTADRISSLEKGAGVSVLGMYRYGEKSWIFSKRERSSFSLPAPSDTITLI